MASASPPLGALATAPSLARSYVKTALAGWDIGHFLDTAELVTSELVTNSVNASADENGSPLFFGGRMLVVRICLFSDGTRLLVQVWDQAPGVPARRHAATDAESGRGLELVENLTGQWGWYPSVPGPGKCTWAELS